VAVALVAVAALAVAALVAVAVEASAGPPVAVMWAPPVMAVVEAAAVEKLTHYWLGVRRPSRRLRDGR